MDNKIIRATRYKDGIMFVFEKQTRCSTPVRENDILKENLFKFFSFNDCKDRNTAYKLLVP